MKRAPRRPPPPRNERASDDDARVAEPRLGEEAALDRREARIPLAVAVVGPGERLHPLTELAVVRHVDGRRRDRLARLALEEAEEPAIERQPVVLARRLRDRLREGQGWRGGGLAIRKR